MVTEALALAVLLATELTVMVTVAPTGGAV